MNSKNHLLFAPHLDHRVCIAACAWVLISITPDPALAYLPSAQYFRCPVGGEQFAFTNPERPELWLPYFVGSRPDGKPNGYPGDVDRPPVCPANGLVLYREFTASEIDRLGAYLQSAEFRTLRQRDNSNYVAYRTELFLDPSAATSPQTLYLLFKATWRSQQDIQRKRRYQDEFIAEASRLDARSRDPLVLSLVARMANALRERGRFTEAKNVIHQIPRQILDVKVPEEITIPEGLGMTTLNAGEIRDAEFRRGLLDYLNRLGDLIASGDTQSNPPNFWR